MKSLLFATLLLPLLSVAAPAPSAATWWSLLPLRGSLPPHPPARNLIERAWQSHPVDRFLLASMQGRGLSPSPPADRATLIRRATFDLLGVPPTPEAIEAFVHDVRPDAYERLLERLLASPHYGERWGRHWLDVARFAESQGFERDKIRDHAWRYRDYVIRAFNEDRPYDRMIREQLAGDVLEPITRDGISATGFLVCGPWDEVGQQQQSTVMKARVREEELEDIISAVSQTFLAMTVNCARCHDHKFDPIPQRDYYRMKAALEGVLPGDRSILTPVETRARDQQVAAVTARLTETEGKLKALDQRGRAQALAARGFVPPPAPPAPFARWTFDGDALDSVGMLHGERLGGAQAVNGRLVLNGQQQFVRTRFLPRTLREKTLEAWVTLPDLVQRGGGVIALESSDGATFDAIVFGEREPAKWIAGSDFFRRTRDLPAAPETARPHELVQIAIAYHADHRIAVYRNGVPYAAPYTPTGELGTLHTFAAGRTRVLFGLRHTGSNGYFHGAIEEARLYDRALSAEEISASYRAAPFLVSPEEIANALTDTQRHERAALLAEVARQREALAALAAPLVYGANPRQPPPTFVLARGEVESQREAVSAGGLSCVNQPAPEWGLATEAPEAERRRRLADWIASPQHPLTARVMVNRLWHYHFGRGLVATPNDFGRSGEAPSHPDLLDWLAQEFIARGWSVKAMHRLVMTSAAYRQAGARPLERGGGESLRARALDADHRLLSGFPLRRLEAEAVRDAMLTVSGQLNPEHGGPSFRPFTVFVNNSHFYTLTDPATPEFNRRTVYRINVGSARSPLLDAFDCPEPSVKTPARVATTTPLQALGLMNNSFVQRQARCFAERVQREAGPDPGAQITRAYRLAFGRRPTVAESERAITLARAHGMVNLCWTLLNASEFVYVQ